MKEKIHKDLVTNWKFPKYIRKSFAEQKEKETATAMVKHFYNFGFNNIYKDKE